MQYEDYLNLVKSRRSIRRFKPDPVPEDYIEKILEVARWAMSGANGQPWQFIVVKDQKIRHKLGEVYDRDSRTTGVVEATRMPEYRMPRYRSLATPKIPWRDAPVIIAVLGDPRTIMASVLAGRFNFRHVYEQNMANVNQMIHLTAAFFGLGAQWVSLGMPASEEMKPILGVPAILDIFTLAPIGYPADKPKPFRRELNELVSYEKYDMSKFRSDEDVTEFIKASRTRHKESGTYPEAELKP